VLFLATRLEKMLPKTTKSFARCGRSTSMERRHQSECGMQRQAGELNSLAPRPSAEPM